MTADDTPSHLGAGAIRFSVKKSVICRRGCAMRRKWPGGRPRRNGLHLPAHVRHERGQRKKDSRGGGRAHLPAHGVEDGRAGHHHHQPCGRARYQPHGWIRVMPGRVRPIAADTREPRWLTLTSSFLATLRSVRGRAVSPGPSVWARQDESGRSPSPRFRSRVAPSPTPASSPC